MRARMTQIERQEIEKIRDSGSEAFKLQAHTVHKGQNHQLEDSCIFARAIRQFLILNILKFESLSAIRRNAHFMRFFHQFVENRFQFIAMLLLFS